MAGIPGLSDLVALIKVQTEALASLPLTLVNLTNALRGLTEVVVKASETVSAVNRVVLRTDALLEELEGPLREIASELQGPLKAMGPGLQRVSVIINDPVMDEIPKTLTALNRDILPIMRAMAETQSKVAGIAATTDRMMSLVDDMQQRISHLPGANLLARRTKRTPVAGGVLPAVVDVVEVVPAPQTPEF